MEVKKSKKAEIESHRGTWLLMGFIAVLTFMFVAFEWAEYDKKVDTSVGAQEPVFVQELVPITVPKEPLPPPPPESTVTEVITIAPDDTPEADGKVEGTEMSNAGVEVKHIPIDEPEPEPTETEIFVFAEKMPEFKGGAAAMNAFLAKEMRYPPVPQENGIQGKVIVQFVVDKDGSITNIEVVRGVHPQLDKEAVRVIGLMPKWNPGMQREKPVRVKYTVPVFFKLQ